MIEWIVGGKMSADFAADQEGGLMNGKGNQLSQLF